MHMQVSVRAGEIFVFYSTSSFAVLGLGLRIARANVSIPCFGMLLFLALRG